MQCEDMDRELDEQLQSIYGHSFKTIDATDDSDIVTIHVERSISDIETNGNQYDSDVYLATVANAGERNSTGSESIIKLYEVERQKLDEYLDDNEQKYSKEIDGDYDGDSDDYSGGSTSSMEMLD